MRSYSRLLRVLPAGACALALAACGKNQNHTYVVPDEPPSERVKNFDAKSASLRLADAAYEKGEFAMAAQLYYRAAELNPGNADVKVKLAFAMFKAGSAGDAEKIFRAALAQDAKNLEAMRGLAHSLVVQGRAGEALPLYRQAIAAGGAKDARLYAGLGAALDMAGKHAEARAAYQTGLRLAPDDFGLRNNLALSYAMSGDAEKAKAILEGMSQNPATARKAQESLSTVNAIVAEAVPARPAPRKRELAAAPPANPPAAPPAEKGIDARIDTNRAGEVREVAEVTAPPARPARASRKATADFAVTDAGDDVIYIQTGRAGVARAETRHVPAMSFRSDAATPEDAAAEVIDLLAQAERGPRFVWQEARRPDQS
jgi:Flp pilus assembly protein TadD